MSRVKPFKMIPGPASLPILGNLWLYKLGYEDPIFFHQTIDNLYKRYGPLVKQNLGNKTIIHAFSPEDAKTIYKSEGKMPYIMPLQDTILLFRKNENLTLGLGNSNGDEWYRLRNSLRHLLLTPKGIQHFTKGTDSVTSEFVHHLKRKRKENGCIPELKTELAKWSLETAGLMCFGSRKGYMSEAKRQKTESLLKANKSVFYLSTILKFSLPFYEYCYSPVWNQLQKSETEILNASVNNTKEALQEIEELKDDVDLLNERYNLLLNLMQKEEIAEKDIYILTQSLFTDSLTTTVPALIYNMYCLALNPDKQEKAYKEISRLIKPGEPITNEIINELSYIKAVIKETFRFYPVGTEISRILKSDVILSGYEVPKETHVNINMNSNFFKEEYFKQPKSFLPERWLRSNDFSSQTDPFVLTPFGHGARTCLGRRFAEQNLYIALAHLLSNFKFYLEPSDSSMIQIFNILLFPSKYLNIRFQLR
ncbi:probable cytochrome P450 CYP44 [Cimex lectularius]|uniref:Cytochrome P450 n=1 Tax=Cimex lectularius TaxID=79782 RepID=A0A8I6S9S8_CIMLE|nr:probable cytochrome P450 CYP44 [Cimex lectularius]